MLLDEAGKSLIHQQIWLQGRDITLKHVRTQELGENHSLAQAETFSICLAYISMWSLDHMLKLYVERTSSLRVSFEGLLGFIPPCGICLPR